MKSISDLGWEFQALRKANRQTQSAVAARVGMTQEALSRFERGRGADFSLTKLLRLAHALGHEVALVSADVRPTLEDVLAERQRGQAGERP